MDLSDKIKKIYPELKNDDFFWAFLNNFTS